MDKINYTNNTNKMLAFFNLNVFLYNYIQLAALRLIICFYQIIQITIETIGVFS